MARRHIAPSLESDGGDEGTSAPATRDSQGVAPRAYRVLAMDDIWDGNPFDLDEPQELVLAAGSGILDDETPCQCFCGCERPTAWPEDRCEPCGQGDHWDPNDPFNDEPGRR